jgi:hypothetical protein
MSTADHAAAVERLSCRAFPPRDGRDGTVVSGPCHHWAQLSADRCAGGAGERWDELTDQYEAERGALVDRLAGQWGAPEPLSLWSLLERARRGEEIPEPWHSLSLTEPCVDLWRVGGRWAAVAVLRWRAEQEVHLVAVVTETDPP